MPGLPKIALARLKAKPQTPNPSGPSLPPDNFQGADHPDANLLAAFVEKTLTEKERAQVLNHLVRCTECREVAALTVPTEVSVAEPSPVATVRRWRPWLVFRWVAMAAVLGAVTMVVVLHPGMWNSHPEVSKATRPPAPAGNVISSPQTVPAPPVPSPAAAPVQTEAGMEARGSARGLATAGKISGPQQDLVMNDQLASAKAKQRATLMYSSAPPVRLKSANGPAPIAARKEAEGGSAVTAEALPAPPPASAPAGAPSAAPAMPTKSSADSQAGLATVRATSQSNEASAGSAGGAGFRGGIGAFGGLEAAKRAPEMTAQASSRVTAAAPMVAMRAKNAETKAGPPVVLWSIDPDGQVQRSTDGGKTLEQINVAHGIKFRAIAALGNEVWTGGTHGALFHSADGGATWSRVEINYEGNTITEAVTSIQLRDPQHLTITTASGSQWVSEDSGQSWQIRP